MPSARDRQFPAVHQWSLIGIEEPAKHLANSPGGLAQVLNEFGKMAIANFPAQDNQESLVCSLPSPPPPCV